MNEKLNELQDAFNQAIESLIDIFEGLKAEGIGVDEPEIIEREGLRLQKVRRLAREGDYVRFSKEQADATFDLTAGKLYGVFRLYSALNFRSDDQSRRYHLYNDKANRTTENTEVFEVIEQHEQIPVAKGVPKALTANEQRAELIEKAKKFVEKYQAVRDGDEEKQDTGNRTARGRWYETDFFVKDNKVTAVVYGLAFGIDRVKGSLHVGRAECVKGDVFNEHIGKAIALSKALEIDIPEEFLNAVQPDKKVVGMVVRWGRAIRTVAKELIIGETCQMRSQTSRFGKIINDTNAEYTNGA